VADHVLSTGLDVAFFGSDEGGDVMSYHRGILAALAARGHEVRAHLGDAAVLLAAVPRAGRADVILKASGAGVLDAMLDGAVLAQRRPGQRIVYWDAHPHASLTRLHGDPRGYRARIPRFDLVITASGDDAVARGYEALGARRCVPLDVALDPDAQPPAVPSAAFAADLSLLAPAGDASLADAFFFAAARALPERRFVLGGAGWDGVPLPDNVRWVGEIGAAVRGSFHASAGIVLHLGDSSDACHLEAACAGACVITDACEGLERFLTRGREVLVAEDGMEVARLLRAIDPCEAQAIGQAARRRVLAEHTYARRAAALERWIAQPLRHGLDGRAPPPALAS
jgi:spore maturation protein CgeB